MHPEAQALIARLRSQPDDLDAYEALKVHYHSSNDFASLANLVEGWAARQSDPRVAADAFHEAARTVSYYLDDQPRAIELLEHALDRVSDHAEAASDLAQLLTTLGDGSARVGSLERKASRLANLGADPVLIAAVHHELGEIWDKSLERPDRAVVHYRSAFELDPEHVPAMYATREIYRKSGDLRTAAKVYELEIAAEQDTTRAVMLLRELAHLHREGLSDPDAAIATLERALEQLPRDLEVSYELAAALLTRSGSRGDTEPGRDDRRRAASLLFRVAQRSEGESQIAFLESALDAAPDYDEALTTLELAAPAARAEDRLPLRYIRYLALVPDGPNAAERRKKVAAAYEAAGQIADAIACLEPIATTDPAVSTKLAELYAIAGRPEEAKRERKRSLGSMSEIDRIAHFEAELSSATKDSAEADAAARELLALVPGHAAASETRLGFARSSGDHAALRELLLARATDTGRADRERGEAYRELAVLADGPLGDPDLAVRAREALVSLSPGDRDARAKLKQTMRLGQKWNELADVLSWEAQNEEDVTAQRNAALSLDELTTRARLDVRRVVTALATVYGLLPADTAVRDRLLERRLEAGDVREALPLIESKASEAPTLRDKTTLLGQAAAIRESLGDASGAVDVLCRWLDADPSAAAPADKAIELGERSGDPALLARVLEKRASITTGAIRAGWFERLATLRAESLGDAAGAIDALREATAASGDEPRLRLALERALAAEGRFEDLRESLRHRSASGEPEDRIAVLREVARVSLEHLSDEAGAIDAHRAVRAIREDLGSLEFLAQRARDHGHEPELIALLSARYVVDADPGHRAATVLELARLLDRPDRDPARARELLEAVRSSAPQPKPVLEHLLTIYEAAGDEAAVAGVIADLLDHEPDERRALSLARRLHALATERLDSEPLTAKSLAKWSALAPSALAPLEALVEMHVRAGRDRDAGDALVELGKRVDSPSDAEAKLLAATERYEAANDLGAAIEAARLAQRLSFGGVAARDRLGVIAEKASRFEIVLEVADARANEALETPGTTAAARIEALAACASIARSRLADARKAEAYLLRASELAEGDAELVARVETIAAELDRDTDDAGSMLERALVTRLLDRAKTEEGDARAARIDRAAKILSEAIGDHDAAFQLLAESTEEDPPELLLTRSIDVAIRGAKVTDLASQLSARFDDAVDGDVARRYLEAHAELYRRVQRASDEADILRRLYTMRATSDVRDRLVDALARAGRHDDRIIVLEQAIRRATDEHDRNELARQVARIWDAELGNRSEALDAWKRILRFVPGDEEAAAAFERYGARRPSLLPAAPTRDSVSGAKGLDSTSVKIPPPPKPPTMEAPASATPPPSFEPLPAVTTDPSAPSLEADTTPPPPGSDQGVTKPPPAEPLASVMTKPSALPLPGVPTTRAPSIPPPLPATDVTDEDGSLDFESIDDLDELEELDELDDAPRDSHVRPHVSLPPPLPPRGRPE